MAIPCEKYDYLEIACMFEYQIKIILTDSREVIGIAKNLLINEKRKEVLQIHDGSELGFVYLEELIEVIVLTKNAKFQSVRFC